MNKQLVSIIAIAFALFGNTYADSSIDAIQVPVSSGSSITIDLKGKPTHLNVGTSGIIHYDVGGRIDKIGDTAIKYDVGGRIDRVGDMTINYDVGGRIGKIGDTVIDYDIAGRVGKIGDATIEYDVGGRLGGVSANLPRGLKVNFPLEE